MPLTPFDLRFSKTRPTRLKEDNIVYHMQAYSNFNYEAAPFLVIHDRLDGIYMLRFTQEVAKVPIAGHSCTSIAAEQPSLSESEEDSWSDDTET